MFGLYTWEVQQSVNRIKRFSHLEALLLLTDAAGSNTHTFPTFPCRSSTPQVCVRTSGCGCFCLVKNIGLMELMVHTVEAVFWPQISSSALSTLFVVTHQRSMDGSKMSVCSFLFLNPVFADERHRWHTPFLSASHHTTHTDECLHAHTPAAELLPQTYLNCDLTTRSIHSFFYPEIYGSTPLAGLKLLPWWQRGPGVDLEWINFIEPKRAIQLKFTSSPTKCPITAATHSFSLCKEKLSKLHPESLWLLQQAVETMQKQVFSLNDLNLNTWSSKTKLFCLIAQMFPKLHLFCPNCPRTSPPS